MELKQRMNSQQSAVHWGLRSFVLGLLLFTFSPVEAQQIYRWVDERGVIHYSHQPPLGKVPTSLDALPPAEPTQQHPTSEPAKFDSLAFNKGLLWEVHTFGRRAAAPSNYIFGTIHSEDPRVLQLPGQAQQALAQSKNFCMEFLPDMGNTAALTKSMVYTDGQNLQTVIGQSLFGQLIPLMSKRGIPAQAFMLFKPWAVYMTLSVPQPKTGMFLDLLLYEIAKRQGKSSAGSKQSKNRLRSSKRQRLTIRCCSFGS
jgi:hypothetical protein